ncbi:DUF6113 family protein [Phytoactinopolyspora endophytica]|uniref:DUF6113 family protein n=1 Tax=Phytoactinopolyspora endophytica TaxID=1642495 RepID=UPI00101D04A5|nr:DUF6113 family protein [Phytoactinopolyspora endophytica]
MRTPPALSLLLHATLLGALAAVAVVTAVAGAFVHRWAGGVGIFLAVGAAVSVCVLARRAARSRLGIAVVGLCWLVPVLVLAQERPAGDVVIAADTTGLVFLFGGAIGLAVTLGMGTGRMRPMLPAAGENETESRSDNGAVKADDPS